MKIIAESIQEERLLSLIEDISDNLVTQDNRATMMPMWTILENGKSGKDYGAVTFFTQEAAESHLITDAHHYDRPSIYIRSAHNNPEIQAIVNLLILAGGNNVPQNHYKVV